MSVRRRPPPRVAPAVSPLSAAGSLHGPAIGFKPGRALPVGGPVKFRPEDVVDEQGEPLLDPISFKKLVPNTVALIPRRKLDKTGWEIKVGDTWQKLLAGTVWAVYIAAGQRNVDPTNPFNREPMGRDDYEALKALYQFSATEEEWKAMRKLERLMGWDQTPYTMDPDYRARQLELRGQDEAPEDEEDEVDEVETLTEEEMQRLRQGLRDDAGRRVEGADAAALADVQRRQDRLVAEAANEWLRGRGDPLVPIPDDPNEDVVLTDEQRQIGNDMLAGRLNREVIRDHNLLHQRVVQGDRRSLADAPPPDVTEEEAETLAEEAQFAADMERARQASLGGEPSAAPRNLRSAFEEAADWSSSDDEDNDAAEEVRRNAASPSAPPHWSDDFRQSAIGEWLLRTFAEIADIVENVAVDNPQFDIRANRVMSRDGPYTVDRVEVHAPPDPGEAAPRLGDEDRDQVHNTLRWWVRSLLSIVKRYKTAGEEMGAGLSARALLGDISLSIRSQQEVNFQYKREVTSQFRMSVNYLIANFDLDEEVRRSAAMEMSPLPSSWWFAPPDEQPSTAPAPAEDAFRQSEIGRWLYQTFGEIADIAKNVDPTDTQFATRSEAVLSRDGRYDVYAVQLYVPPFPGEAAPRLGDEDSQEVHDMLHGWVQSLLSIVKWYQTAGEERDAGLAARALLGDISLLSHAQQEVNFQYKAEVMEQFYKAVKSLIAEFDPNDQTRLNARMDMLGGAQLESLAFLPPEDDDADGLYRNDGGDAVTAWARDVTGRLRQLYEAGYEYGGWFQQRINELIQEGRPVIDLNIWLRNSDRAPVANEQEQLQDALHDWQTRAAMLMQAWRRAVDRGTNDSRFNEPRRLKSEWITILHRAPDSDDVPNFVGQQRVYDVFAEYISWLDTTYDTEYQPEVSIPVLYQDRI
jgi:hypothetical protein